MASADAFLDHFISEAARGAFRVRRRRLDVGRRLARDGDEFQIEHEHARWLARLSLVGERFRNPHPALFPRHHQLQRLAEARDDRVHAERHRFASSHRAVDHLAVGVPAGVVDGGHVGRRRMIFAGSRRQHFPREAGRGFRGVGEVARSVAVYRDVLGFAIDATVPEGPPYVFASVTSGAVAIFLNAPEPAYAEYPAFKDRPIGGTLTLFIEVEGIDRWHASLKDKVT